MEEKFQRFDSALALVCDDKQYTYSELSKKIEEYKLQIKDKIPANSVVSILSDYSFESISLFFT